MLQQQRQLLQVEEDWYKKLASDGQAALKILLETIAKAPRWVPVNLPDFEMLVEEKRMAVEEAERRAHEMTQRCNSLLSKIGHGVGEGEILTRGTFRFFDGKNSITEEGKVYNSHTF